MRLGNDPEGKMGSSLGFVGASVRGGVGDVTCISKYKFFLKLIN